MVVARQDRRERGLGLSGRRACPELLDRNREIGEPAEALTIDGLLERRDHAGSQLTGRVVAEAVAEELYRVIRQAEKAQIAGMIPGGAIGDGEREVAREIDRAEVERLERAPTDGGHGGPAPSNW